MKEQTYELETKCSELELALEEQKGKYDDEMASLKKECTKSKEMENDLQSKHEALKKKYEQESKLLKTSSDNDKALNE